jgi:hypothetical protein
VKDRRWQSARTLAWAVLVASLVGIVMWPAVSAGVVTRRQYEVTAGLSLSSLIALYFFKELSPRSHAAISGVLLGSSLLMVGITNSELAAGSHNFSAFFGFKLIAIAVAMIPVAPAVLGYLVIVLCGVAPLVEYYVIYSPEYRQNINIPEPWVTFMFAVLAFLVFLHRHREVLYERQIIQTLSEKEALAERARMIMAIRDRSNTPLQIVVMSASLLRKRQTDAALIAEKLEYAIARLRELSEAMADFEEEARWSQGSTSFDALKILQEDRHKRD